MTVLLILAEIGLAVRSRVSVYSDVGAGAW